jgi:predicted MPP superfamily phosphohydrolase
MPIVGLPKELEGKSLVQISDLHVGQLVDFDYLVGCIQRLASLDPDYVVFTGDFMSCRGPEQIDQVARLLEHFRPARLGCFAVLGNHDYGAGFRQTDVADKLSQRLNDAGLRVLRNEAAITHGLQFLGIDDFWSPNFNLPDAVSQVDFQRPTITLCHNPDVVDLPEWSSAKGWVLAGHTHGGQCKPPFLPPPILPVRNRRYTSGEFDLGGDRWMYINPGLGYLRRVRFNVRPEITYFRLQTA